MLPEALNFKQDESLEEDGLVNGSLFPASGHFPATALPAENVNMECDKQEVEQLVPNSPDSTDDDQDMSDGGAPLTMTLSHAEELNNELDMLDAEIMGHENLDELLYDDETFYPPRDDPPSDLPSFLQSFIDHQLSSHQALGDLSSAMSEVSNQLQHIQDGQDEEDQDDEEDEDLEEAQDEQQGHPASNAPFHFPFSPHQQMPNPGPSDPTTYVSMADIQAPTSTGAVSSNAPQLDNTQANANVTAADILLQILNQPSTLQNASNLDDDTNSNTDPNEVENYSNFGLGDFLHHWGRSVPLPSDRRRASRGGGPSLPAVHKQRFMLKLDPIRREDLDGDHCDIQRINWQDLGVSRSEARERRQKEYKNYRALDRATQWHPRLNGTKLLNTENYFRFRQMEFKHSAHLSHFQLRNLMTAASRDRIFFAGRSKIFRYNCSQSPDSAKSEVMDLSVSDVRSSYFSQGIQITSISAEHGVLVAGGYCGEYAMVNLGQTKDSKHVEGIISEHHENITNHVHTHLSRTSSLPLATFSSNDTVVRTMDITTQKWLYEHKYGYAINYTAVSPDQRLRVLVGDDRKVMICNAETGEVLQDLEGHLDFGFACDWADDGWTVATGNQDMQVKVWDARKWTTSQGRSCPVTTIAAEMAGVRKLKFSPVGSGKRVLVAAEPADIISVIDAETFASKQTLSFFGEIGGVDFTNNGRDLIVANCDNMRGGMMEFERSDLASQGLYSVARHFDKGKHGRSRGYGYDWASSEQDLAAHPKTHGTTSQRSFSAAMLAEMPHF